VDEDKSQILIFGGRSALEVKLQDLYAWDVAKQTLEQLSPNPEESDPSGPAGRSVLLWTCM